MIKTTLFSDVKIKIDVPFEKVIHGGVINQSYYYRSKCKECDGSGSADG